jgi:hypothetical protein
VKLFSTCSILFSAVALLTLQGCGGGAALKPWHTEKLTEEFSENKAVKSLGYKNKRLVHGGSKRANPFSPGYDVHYAAGLVCTDCHVPEGHKIPRGRKGTDLVANDLPDKDVSCENCHTTAPHT